MRLHNYILELTASHDYGTPRSQPISKEVAMSFIQDKASDAASIYTKEGGYIYRGLQSNIESCLFNDPSKYDRMSKNTGNFYTVLFSEILPSWKKYPKRSKSLICSSSESGASSYGNPFAVFPQNGANIGVVPARDMWGGFQNSIGQHRLDLEDFNRDFEFIFSELGIKSVDFSNKTTTLQAISKLQEALDNIDPSKLSSRLRNMAAFDIIYPAKGKDLIKFFDTFLSPTKNGFQLIKVGKPLPENKEVWTDAPCVLVPLKMLGEVIPPIKG